MVFNFLKKSNVSKNETAIQDRKSELYFEDISRFQGVYFDFQVVYDFEINKFKLLNVLHVEGLNVDILSPSEQQALYEDFGVFLAQNVTYEPQITSLNTPTNLDEFINEWETTVENYRNVPGHNQALLNLKASYLYHYKKMNSNFETSKKKHYVIIDKEISKLDDEGLKIAYENLREDSKVIRTALSDMLSKYDCQIEYCTVQDMKIILEKYYGG